jgi:hypothetical protein
MAIIMTPTKKREIVLRKEKLKMSFTEMYRWRERSPIEIPSCDVRRAMIGLRNGGNSIKQYLWSHCHVLLVFGSLIPINCSIEKEKKNLRS